MGEAHTGSGKTPLMIISAPRLPISGAGHCRWHQGLFPKAFEQGRIARRRPVPLDGKKSEVSTDTT